ncbi:hypothetical protein RLEG12_09420 (plasmid) [Rhizobium leguminosarum bv. trifolii CB782]|nr:hypothetical protein RLEG12_09420 [Rhizobium leguminosarum bv. trifolii CB782]
MLASQALRGVFAILLGIAAFVTPVATRTIDTVTDKRVRLPAQSTGGPTRLAKSSYALGIWDLTTIYR